MLYANNLEFDNVPLGQMIHERTGLPVYVDNDANVAAWGEYCAGAGKGTAAWSWSRWAPVSAAA